jgi:hypothetical protein
MERMPTLQRFFRCTKAKTYKRLIASRGVLLGGNANNRTNCSLSYANANNTPSDSNSNVSSQLYFSFLISYISNYMRGNNRASWRKIKIQKCAGRETERSLSEKQKKDFTI